MWMFVPTLLITVKRDEVCRVEDRGYPKTHAYSDDSINTASQHRLMASIFFLEHVDCSILNIFTTEVEVQYFSGIHID